MGASCEHGVKHVLVFFWCSGLAVNTQPPNHRTCPPDAAMAAMKKAMAMKKAKAMKKAMAMKAAMKRRAMRKAMKAAEE